MAFFLLTGEDAFTGGSQSEIFARHIALAAEPPSGRSSEPIRPSLDAVILRCLEKNPGARFASAWQLRDALVRLAIPPWPDEQANLWWDEVGKPLQNRAVASRTKLGSREALVPDFTSRVRRQNRRA